MKNVLALLLFLAHELKLEVMEFVWLFSASGGIVWLICAVSGMITLSCQCTFFSSLQGFVEVSADRAFQWYTALRSCQDEAWVSVDFMYIFDWPLR